MNTPVRRKVIFRADGSDRIGLGHLIRSQALAEMLADDFDCVFALAEAPAVIAEDLASRFEVYWLPPAALPPVAASQQQEEASTPLAAWQQQAEKTSPAAATQQQQAATLAALASPDDIIVLDGYPFDTAYQQVLRERGCKLVSIDDIHAYPFVVDAIINTAGGVRPAHYQALPGTRFCLGLRYALLRRPFRLAQAAAAASPPSAALQARKADSAQAANDNPPAAALQAGEARSAQAANDNPPAAALQAGEARSAQAANDNPPAAALQADQVSGDAADAPALFICLGGADPHNDTLTVVQRCLSLGYFGRYELVLGAAYRWQSALDDYLLRQATAEVRIHRNLSAEAMAALMQRCPYAVCSPSTIAYEYAAVGGVLYLQQTADNQEDVRNHLLSAGLARDFVRDFAPPGDDAREQALRQRQRQAFDGRQAARLRRLFFGLHIRLRKATTNDCRRYFDWANDPAVRQQSFSSEPIPYEQHERWFAAKLADPAEHLYLLSLDGQPMGQVRFSLTGERGETAIISYALAAPFRGRGLAAPMLERAIAQLAADQPTVQQLLGYVKNTNEASRRVFTSLEFYARPTELYPDSSVFIASTGGSLLQER
jgi:spore coat polysaccharide biosynthesis predicted glycosyltransferase SpsG/L-amino acid N-acyltransferase YncA